VRLHVKVSKVGTCDSAVYDSTRPAVAVLRRRIRDEWEHSNMVALGHDIGRQSELGNLHQTHLLRESGKGFADLWDLSVLDLRVLTVHRISRVCTGSL
jgi:hypothetical protein